MWDETMLKAAFVHDRIMEVDKQPDVQVGALRFTVKHRATKEEQPVRLEYTAPKHQKTIWRWAWAKANGVAHGATHLTEATVHLDNDRLTLTTRARCCPKDNPRRWVGRTIALMRMAGIVGPMGYDVLAAWNKDIHIVIPADCQVPEGYVPAELCKKAWAKNQAAGLPVK